MLIEIFRPNRLLQICCSRICTSSVLIAYGLHRQNSPHRFKVWFTNEFSGQQWINTEYVLDKHMECSEKLLRWSLPFYQIPLLYCWFWWFDDTSWLGCMIKCLALLVLYALIVRVKGPFPITISMSTMSSLLEFVSLFCFQSREWIVRKNVVTIISNPTIYMALHISL